MSYEIEHYKAVFEVRADTPYRTFFPGDTTKHIALFLFSHDSNNVSPKTFHGALIGVAYRAEGEGYQLPGVVFELASAADGGGIQPWGKTVTGLSYLKSWRRRAKSPTPLFLGAVLAMRAEITMAGCIEGKGNLITEIVSHAFPAAEALFQDIGTPNSRRVSACVNTPETWGAAAHAFLAKCDDLAVYVRVPEREFESVMQARQAA